MHAGQRGRYCRELVFLNLFFSELVDTHDKLAGWQMPSSQFFCSSKSLSYCSAAPIEAEPALLTKLTAGDRSWAGYRSGRSSLISVLDRQHQTDGLLPREEAELIESQLQPMPSRNRRPQSSRQQ